MFDFIKPYLPLVYLALVLGLFGSGVAVGYKWEARAHLADVVTKQNAAIEAANKDAEAEKQRALAAAKAEADAKLAARTARMKGELDAAKKARPECARDAESLGLLNDSIRVANGEKAAAVKLPVTMRTATDPAEWLRLGHEKLGVSGGGSVRSVPTPAR